MLIHCNIFDKLSSNCHSKCPSNMSPTETSSIHLTDQNVEKALNEHSQMFSSENVPHFIPIIRELVDKWSRLLLHFGGSSCPFDLSEPQIGYLSSLLFPATLTRKCLFLSLTPVKFTTTRELIPERRHPLACPCPHFLLPIPANKLPCYHLVIQEPCRCKVNDKGKYCTGNLP